MVAAKNWSFVLYTLLVVLFTETQFSTAQINLYLSHQQTKDLIGKITLQKTFPCVQKVRRSVAVYLGPLYSLLREMTLSF